MSGVKQTRTTWALPQPLRNAQTIPYIPDVDSAARGANLVALQGSLVRTDLWYEVALLSKLLYKSKNQHRSSKHFQYLTEVKRCMKLLLQLQLSDLVGDLNHLRSNAGVGMPATASLVMFGRANKLHVPSQQAGILVLQRLLAGCRLAVRAIPAAHAAAAQLLAQLSMTYFMPFCLTALAMVARIQVLVCQLLLDNIKAYNSLLPLVIVLPWQELVGTGIYPDLPHMLSCSWTAGVPTLSLIPHTDFPSFAAAAQAFHTAHHANNATQLASSFAQDFGHKIGRGAAATTAAASGDDMGEKVSRATVKLAAGVAEDIGERVNRAKVTPAAGTVEDVGQKVNSGLAVAPTAKTGGGIGNQISGLAPAKSNDSNVSDDVNRAAAQAGSKADSKADTKGARAASDSNLGQEVSRPSSTENVKTVVSDGSTESLPEALGSTSAQSVAAAASLVPKAQSSMNKLSEAQQHRGISRDCIPLESHKAFVGLAAKPTRRQGAQTEQLARPGDATLLVFEDRLMEAGGAEGSQALRYRHTLPSVMLGSQAGRVAQTDEAPSMLHSRLHRQSDRAGSTRKRSREEASPDHSGLDPQRRPQPTPVLSQPLHLPQTGYQRSSQSPHQFSESRAASSHRPMAPGGQARPQPRAEILPSGALPGSKLTTGTAPLGKAFGLGQKAANQPAFIRIGGNNPRSQDGEAAVTAAPDVPRRTQGQFVIQEAMPVLSAASAAPAVVEAAEVSPQKAANSATASAAVVESSGATATPPAYRGEVTPEPAVMQSPVGQQMLLPTSRRKRKGQKAAKVREPARSNSAWQELVELSGAAEPAAALAGKALSGHEQAVSKGDQDQYPANTPVAQAPTSTPPSTQDIMKMLLGTK
ncbi:hypothetical protein WJX82_007614 [Trebouxia sp. C0006]